MEEVHGVLGKKQGLPCDIRPRDRDDAVAMVLWFKETIGEPLYRVSVISIRKTTPTIYAQIIAKQKCSLMKT
ncbi:unnamed protein product [Phaedon cochleariae]|uniref:Uncharacterized protein n=1 Tax=Phaedon cochleariae TaxID=80249 RepID=A0A9N9SBN4_PHACE|nr:unnamed protein product [Phaedon cochleariae]